MDQHQPFGDAARRGKIAADAHRFPLQQLRGHGFDALGIFQCKVLGLGPGVNGKDAVVIGGGGNHGDGVDKLRHPPGQRVGPAQMARHQGNTEPAPVIQYQHRRVTRLAF